MQILIDCTPDELAETIFKIVDCDVEIDDEDDDEDDDVTYLSSAAKRDRLLIQLLSELLAAREKQTT